MCETSIENFGFATPPTKVGKNRVSGGNIFWVNGELHARVVAFMLDNLPDFDIGAVKFFVSLRHVLLSMHRFYALWRHKRWLAQGRLKYME